MNMFDKYMELVKKYKGFEIILTVNDDEVHSFGFNENTAWYCTENGGYTECFTGVLEDGVWTDTRTVKAGDVSTQPAPAGTAMEKVLARAFFGQDEIDFVNQNFSNMIVGGYHCRHYSFNYGIYSYDVLDQFGITGRYADKENISKEFVLSKVRMGKMAKAPVIK